MKKTIIKDKPDIPKLRFPGFFGAWEEKRLGEIAKIERGRFSPRPRNNPIYYGGEIPFVQTSDVVNSKGNIRNYSQTLNQKGLKVSKKFSKGTILITIAANIGYAGVLEIDMACPDSLIGITCGEGIYNYFLNYLLEIEQPKMDYLAVAAAQKNINIEFLKPYKFIIPNLPEQQKIASFLSSVDEWIQNLRAQKESLQSYKKGMMQKIFSRELRFKDDDGKDFLDWEEKPFQMVFQTIASKNYQIKNSEISDAGEYRVVDQGKDLIAGYSNKQSHLFRKPPVIIFGDHTTVLKYIDFQFVVGADGTKILTSIDTKDSLKFLYYTLLADPVESEGYKRHFSILKNRIICLPLISEQQKIAEFLTSLDNLIESKQQQIARAEEWKKGVMQGVFV